MLSALAIDTLQHCIPAGHTLTIAAPPSFVPFHRADVGQSIPSRFARLVAQGPDRLAVKSGATALSYRELNRFANRIAAGVGRVIGPTPQPVALCLGQGVDLLAAILGVLKAGHFYVPLDPTQPRATLVETILDSDARLILTDMDRSAVASELLPGLDVLDVAELEHDCDDNPGLDVTPDALACIYYTSGSTGRAKGVVDTHRNVLHNVLRYTNSLKISSTDRLTLVQPPSFSGVVSSMFGALLNGAAVFPFDMAKEGVGAIGLWLLRERITVYHSVPAIFRHFLRVVSRQQRFPDMRVVRLEGDGARIADVSLYKQHFPRGCVLAHGLGATECGLVRRLVIDHDTELSSGIVPLGYEVDDVTVHILAADGRRLEADAIGEIAVESDYLSPGYWRRPDLTARAFTGGWKPGKRLYRTGDLGRLTADGCLEHLGRKDGNAKIRGQFVDVQTVEAAIVATGLVSEATVVVRSSNTSEAILVAYVVWSREHPVSVSGLRRQLAGVVPRHMLPARFVVLDQLPLTANLKVDRTSLPSVDCARPRLGVPFVAPRSEIERQIAAAWATTLGLDQVGVRDDFFDLGGDSLDAVGVLACLADRLAVDLPPTSLFEASTVEALARAIEDQHRSASIVDKARPATLGSPLVPVQPNGSKRPFFFLHAEFGGDGFYCLNLARHLGADQPFFGLSPLGRDGEPVPRTIETIAATYVSLVRDVQPRGPYSLGGFCSGAIVAWEIAQQLGAAGEDVSVLVLIEPPAVDLGKAARLIDGVADLIALCCASREKLVPLVARARRLNQWRYRSWSTLARDLISVIRGAHFRPGGESKKNPESFVAEEYSRAIDVYLPRTIGVPVLCLQAAEEGAETRLDGWRRLAADFTAQVIPGDHNSCIITHARSLALALADRLSA